MKKNFFGFILGLTILCTSVLTASAAASSKIAKYYDDLPGVPKGNTDCVAFIKYLHENKPDLLPDIPNTSLSTFSNKTAVINTFTPDRGCIAICKSSKYPKNGHVAFVDSVSSDRETITLVEAGGFIEGHISTRTGNKIELSIVGYYNPYTVSFYEHHDEEGWATGKFKGDSAQTATQMGFSNDQLSCVEIRQDNITVVLYEHDNFQGRKIVLSKKGTYNLGDMNFNDICSSYTISGS